MLSNHVETGMHSLKLRPEVHTQLHMNINTTIFLVLSTKRVHVYRIGTNKQWLSLHQNTWSFIFETLATY